MSERARDGRGRGRKTGGGCMRLAARLAFATPPLPLSLTDSLFFKVAVHGGRVSKTTAGGGSGSARGPSRMGCFFGHALAQKGRRLVQPQAFTQSRTGATLVTGAGKRWSDRRVTAGREQTLRPGGARWCQRDGRRAETGRGCWRGPGSRGRSTHTQRVP